MDSVTDNIPKRAGSEAKGILLEAELKGKASLGNGSIKGPIVYLMGLCEMIGELRHQIRKLEDTSNER